MDKVKKKLGLGTISLLLSIIGILFAFSFGDNRCYGDIILEFVGIKAWSNSSSGIHYTIFYSLIFFVPSVIIGYKFKNDLGATVGRYVSLIMIVLNLLLTPALIVTL
ncbi:hypothetical protein [Desulfitobacterium sp. AusDCA]|uniref:hypothetical protein n=1 Tax=Desulfitobacterium sp. AusDCA TaxID=3240383 RepID=UPI003DA6F939